MAHLVRSSEETHAELARTVGEFGRWLSVMDAGLGALLAATGKEPDVIEEAAEPEESEGEAYTYGNDSTITIHNRGGSVPFAVTAPS
jgi:hypothetical protein